MIASLIALASTDLVAAYDATRAAFVADVGTMDERKESLKEARDGARASERAFIWAMFDVWAAAPVAERTDENAEALADEVATVKAANDAAKRKLAERARRVVKYFGQVETEGRDADKRAKADPFSIAQRLYNKENKQNGKTYDMQELELTYGEQALTVVAAAEGKTVAQFCRDPNWPKHPAYLAQLIKLDEQSRVTETVIDAFANADTDNRDRLARLFVTLIERHEAEKAERVAAQAAAEQASAVKAEAMAQGDAKAAARAAKAAERQAAAA